MCLAWWDRAHARYTEEEYSRRLEGAAAGTSNLDDIPDHDVQWLKIVEDVTFVLEKAELCDASTRGMATPSRRAKRRRETEPETPQKKPAAKAASKRTRSRS